MKLITMPRLAVLAIAGVSLSLAACNNKADDATEAAADQVEASSEATADAMEDAADQMGGASEDAMEAKADAQAGHP